MEPELQAAIDQAVNAGFDRAVAAIDERLATLTKPAGGKPPLSGKDIDQGRLLKGVQGYRYASRFQAPNRRGGVPYKSIAERVADGDRELETRMVRWMSAFAIRDINQMMLIAQERAALDSTSASTGASLVPMEFAQEVVELLGQMTPLATTEFLRVVPMNSERITVPKLTVRPAATYGTQGSPTTATSAGTLPSFGEIELVAREALLLVPVDEKWLADINIEGITYLTELFAEVLAELRNQKLLTGTGNQEPEGVLKNTAILTQAITATNDQTIAKSVTKVYQKIKAKYRRAGIWLTSAAGMTKLIGLQDTQGRFLLQQLTDEPFARLMGKPIFETEAISDTSEDGTHTQLLFGNFKYYVFGDRQQMEARTDNGGGYFAARQVAIRVTERYDGKVGQPEAFCVSTGFPNS